MELPNRIAELRLARGWSQRELARRCEITHPALSKLEHGGTGATLRLVKRIADELGVSVAELFVEPGDREQRLLIEQLFQSLPADDRRRFLETLRLWVRPPED